MSIALFRAAASIARDLLGIVAMGLALLASPATSAGVLDDTAQFVRDYRNVTVYVRIYKSADPIESNLAAQGSGVLLDSGYVLTSRHLIEGVSNETPRDLYAYGSIGSSQTQMYRLEYIDEETRHDLLLLKFHADVANDLKAACVRDTATIQGEKIGILGYPLGGSVLVSVGNISAIEASGIETTITIAAGSSGSPVFDDHGKVIGIARAERRSGGEGADIYVIIPIKRAAKLLIQVEDSGRSDCDLKPDLDWTLWMTSEGYSSEFNRLQAQGNFPVKVEGKNDNGTSHYRGLFIRVPDSVDSWYSYSSHELGKDEAIHEEMTATGHERVWSQSFVDAGGIERHQGVWIRTKTREPFQLPN